MKGRLERGETWALLAVVGRGGLVGGAPRGAPPRPWPFQPDRVDPRGLLGPLVRAADREWDLGIPRSAALFAGLLVAGAAVAWWRSGRLPRWLALALTTAVVLLLLAPASLLAVGLRDATDPWYFTNDSTYQIEIAGDMILDGETPYGRDYDGTGLERFYPAAGFEGSPDRQVALTHFAYFPGTPLTAAAWRLLPRPFDDYRLFVLLATLAAAAIVAANPLSIRAAWFGTTDLPSLALVLLAFALAVRSRPLGAAAALSGAILL